MKTLGSIRIKEQTILDMKRAILKYNEKQYIKINEASYRRLSLVLLNQLILQDKLDQIPIKPEHLTE